MATLKPGGSIWVPPSAQAKIGRETVRDIGLRASDTRTRIDARLDKAIQDGSIESTTTGAPMLNLTLVDPDNELLNSDIFSSQRIDVTMDDIVFRLVQVSRQDNELVELSFEHRLVSYLRAHDDPRKASRATTTRAGFAYKLALEVKATRIVFVSPDVSKRQAREKADPLDKETTDERRGQGFADNVKGITIKGKQATRSQLKNVKIALSVAAGLNASPLATKAMVCAGIGESSFIVQMNQRGSGYGGVFQGDVGARYHYFKINQTEEMARCFLKGGKGFQGGGAMALAKQRPPLSPGEIALIVEGSRSNFSSKGAGVAFYQTHADEAQTIIDNFRGKVLSSSDAQGYYKRFEFTRGAVREGDAKEDSWVALQRLASEVRWRCFITGRRVLYFVSDEQLMRSRPLYLVDPQTSGVQSVTFDMEVGRRTVVSRGKRERKPSEALIKVRLGRWAAPPGSIVELAGYGIADGRWIVDSMTRPLFDADAEIQLRQPQKAFREPAPETATRDSGSGTGRTRAGSGSDVSGSGSTVDKVYAKAAEISRRNLPYGAGGHGQTWGPADNASSMDCSSSTSMALHAGGLMGNVSGPVVSDWFLSWGQAGEGDRMTVWVNPGSGANGHVMIQFKGRNAKRFDTSPWGSGGSGPHMRYTDRSYSGMQPRHARGT